MNGGDEVVAATAGPPQPLEWKFSQVFGERAAGEEVQEVDIISAIEFDKSGDHLATGDRGGRVVLFERTDTKDHGVPRGDLERMDYSIGRHPEFRYKTEFQSHEPEFDYLKSLEIEEKINKIRWCQTANGALFLLSTNDKTIKFWKAQSCASALCFKIPCSLFTLSEAQQEKRENGKQTRLEIDSAVSTIGDAFFISVLALPSCRSTQRARKRPPSQPRRLRPHPLPRNLRYQELSFPLFPAPITFSFSWIRPLLRRGNNTQLMSREQSRKWFEEVVPAIGNLLLRLPSLLEEHFEKSDKVMDGVRTGLRILESQEPGIVFLSQELIAALLGCSLFCLFPDYDRSAICLPMINFNDLFASLYDAYNQKQENKIWCIIHYFQRISSDMPKGVVSFERKVLPFKGDLNLISYPNANFWSTSALPLCKFEVHSSGLIEDQSSEAIEVDFANKYLGGGALSRGCVQEEIRFMVSPELIAGMLFLPSMEDNEAIDIVGVERFSGYKGYASSFRFSGDYVDERDVDTLGRHKTRIVAIDALCSPGMRQYRANFLLREINKAFCGFLYEFKYQQYQKILQENGWSSAQLDASASTSSGTSEGKISNHEFRNFKNDYQTMEQGDNIGVATGNWGCGAFGGDPEVKAIIQWLAASQALRPFVAYYTFGLEALQSLEEVARWILSQRWTVGDLWDMLVEYSTKRSKGETTVGFLQWLVPSIYNHGAEMDLPNSP